MRATEGTHGHHGDPPRCGPAPLLAGVAALVVLIAAFTALGTGGLAGPPLTRPAGWDDWLAARDAVVTTTALLRLVVLALAWYLVGVIALGALARVADVAVLVRATDSLSLPIVRRLLQSALGVGLATAVTTASVTPPPPAPAAAVLAATAPVGPVAPGNPQAPPPPLPPPVRPPPAATPATVHEVVVGEHLWSIARDHLAGTLARTPTDREVAVHWRALIAANRHRLVDRDNPDLILPGQRFVLPSGPPRTPAS